MKYFRTILILSIVILAGCSGAKEAVKGFLGVSTKVLEDKRKDAITKEFDCDLVSCHLKVMKLIRQDMAKNNINAALGGKSLFKVKELESTSARLYIYEDNLRDDFIACYLSESDTTPIGIFFTPVDKNKTLIEVSSPSTFAKETVSSYVFKGLADALKQEKVSNQ